MTPEKEPVRVYLILGSNMGDRRRNLSIAVSLLVTEWVEHKLGRPDHEPEFDGTGHRIYRPRVIDIDIAIYGDRTVSTPELTIPHPQVEERSYAKHLLSQIMTEL